MPTPTLSETLHARQRLNQCIRAFFAARDVLEVETPILSMAGTTDPSIESFVTQYQYAADPGPRWLRTSPEFFHKRLLAAGSGAIYELGKVFRNGELGPRHNPEFTMLEWYRPGFDESTLRAEIIDLLHSCAAAFDRKLPPVESLSFAQLFQRHADLDPFLASTEQLVARAASLGAVGDLDRDAALDLLRSLVIEPALDPESALFVTDFPPSQAALARLKPGHPPTAARFELYLGRLELANGYHELTDADEQRRRFAVDAQVRHQRAQPAVAIDEHFLAALAAGLPDCSGVALGVDRLLCWLLGVVALDTALPFAFPVA